MKKRIITLIIILSILLYAIATAIKLSSNSKTTHNNIHIIEKIPANDGDDGWDG